MGRAAAATFLLALAFPPTLFFLCNACSNVPYMAIDEACVNACRASTQPLLVELCQTVLRGAGTKPTEEVNVYAAAAADYAKPRYEQSMQTAEQLLQNPLPGDERAAYDHCKEKYAEELGLMVRVVDQMTLRSFAYPRQEYVDATVAVTSCGNGLSAFQSSSLYAMNMADQGNTWLAYDLGALIVGK